MNKRVGIFILFILVIDVVILFILSINFKKKFNDASQNNNTSIISQQDNKWSNIEKKYSSKSSFTWWYKSCEAFKKLPWYSWPNYVFFLYRERNCCSWEINRYIENEIRKNGLITWLSYWFYALWDDTKFLTLLYLCKKYKDNREMVINYLKNIFNNEEDEELWRIKDKDIKKFIYYRLMEKVYDPEWRKEILNIWLSPDNVDITRKDFDPIPLSNILVRWYLNWKLTRQEVKKYFKDEMKLILDKKVSYIDPFDIFNIKFYNVIIDWKNINGDCFRFLISWYIKYLNSVLSDHYLPNRCLINNKKEK